MFPTTEYELAEAVKSATGPLLIRGGGTRPVGRPINGTELNLSKLSGITFYDPGTLTLTAKAGTALEEMETVLTPNNQRLAFEPGDYCGILATQGQTTIGGIAAANISGPRRISAGAARDHMLGVRFVDGTGTIVKNGGRVMKNVTGYDLVKLMAGSYGTLGILTEISLKVQPVPETVQTLRIETHKPNTAISIMSKALGTPYEVSGAAYNETAVYLRVEGFASSVEYRTEHLKNTLKTFGNVDKIDFNWSTIKNISLFNDKPGDIWKISCRPSAAANLIQHFPENSHYIMDNGGGLLWVLTGQGVDLRSLLPVFDGHSTLIRANDETRRNISPFQPQPPAIALLESRLRQKFDPRHILNTGLTE